ncbi:CHY zinc finger protein [Halobaculum sp. CBA1158]|uniref:CHY zinc finger protein n=1 Tax=Halobaculum sp. CBA1158 TaxID=2904243 RepID=UPI001F36C3AE|nr:CHY zinc finger protein [Halobaculum sp. CBA1158]UIO98819.1 CHY zinc finger protein [Halobaculum sp. CBA1158]
MERIVHGTLVRGVDVDSATRCAHYDGPRDVIALRFGCCESFVPCSACHDAVADHPAEPWPRERFDEPAVLCGGCGERLSVRAYLDCGFACPACGIEFNPGCASHYDRYFEGVEPRRSRESTTDG